MKEFCKGFVYAFSGIFRACLEEKNMRFHLTLSAYMYCYLLLYDFFTLSKGDWVAIVLATVLVISAELFNTALEKTVDLCTQEIHPLAKYAKDASAGAVLVCAIGAIVVGLIVLWQPEAFEKMFAYYKSHIYMFIVLLVSLAVSVVFVLKAPKKRVRSDG
ncbi:MAG: diacylglycerol kinase family protein [Clostridia bacterium]|nr:diacylglycerol kinase family protein [Clostridia bacterium]